MRAPKTEATGTGGEYEVAAKFAYMGWAAMIEAKHDNGVDMVARPRDPRRFELGMYLGVQVKTGASWFKYPKKDENGEISGWWYRDDDGTDLGARARFPTPQIVLLHDPETNTSYWQHVTADAIRSTGKGAKILVPASQTLDAEHHEKLLAITASYGRGTPLEGSWGGDAEIAPPDQLRHALVVPRLIAPHPNLGTEELSAREALAMVAQLRTSELARYTEEQDVPGLEEALDSEEWDWRFVGALWRRMTENEAGPLREALASAEKSEERVAAAVCLASLACAAGFPEEALEVLNPEIELDKAATVDNAWLAVQKARALGECGCREEAIAAISGLGSLRDEVPNDATAKAIAATAATIAFNLSEWGERDFRELIKRGESVSGWWRSQTVRNGLDEVVERSFEEWANDTRVKWSSEDAAHSRLFAAAVESSHSGDQAGWRNLSALVGKDELLRLSRDREIQEAADGLDTLRLAGETKALQLAAAQVIDSGPCAALAELMGRIEPERSTRSNGYANLLAIEQGGDLAELAEAERLAEWLEGAIEDPGPFSKRTTPHYLVEVQLVTALAGIAPALEMKHQAALLERILKLAPIDDNQLLAQGWARVLMSLEGSAWDLQRAAAAREASARHEPELGEVLLGYAARRGDTDARAQLTERAKGGDIEALWGLGAARELPASVAEAATRALGAQAAKIAADSRAGSVSIGPRDPAHSLARLNAWHPDQANWEPLFELLEERAVPARMKRGALLELSWRAEELHGDAAGRAAKIAKTLSEGKVEQSPFDLDGEAELVPTATVLAVSLGALKPGDAEAHLAKLLGGDHNARRYATLIAAQLGGSEQIGVLGTLARDDQPNVRAHAAAGIARALACGQGGAQAEAIFSECLADPGRGVPLAMAQTLVGQTWANPLIETALEALRSHRSAAVRAAAAEGLDLKVKSEMD